MQPKSKRPLSDEEFFDRAIILWNKVTDILEEGFSDKLKYRVEVDENGVEQYVENENFWRIKLFRERMENCMSNMVANLTHADVIYISDNPTKAIYEYNIRRKYMTDAIGDIKTAIQFMQHEMKRNIKYAKRFRALIKDLKAEIESIKNWRQYDNSILNKVMGYNH